jgi:hypothetical protein
MDEDREALNLTSEALVHEILHWVKKIENASVHYFVWACFGNLPPLYSMMYFPNTTYEMMH